MQFWFGACLVLLTAASWVLRKAKAETSKCELLLEASRRQREQADIARKAALEAHGHVQALAGEFWVPE